MENSSNQCLNCECAIKEGQNYCDNCGQTVKSHRIDLGFIWHELVHAFTHADKGLFFTLLENLKHPGKVSQEYVEGKRKKYFSPFSFFLIILGVSSLLFSKFHLINSCIEKINLTTEYINTHYNLVIFASIPCLSFLNWLFFKKSGYNFAENLILVSYTAGVRSVFISLVVAPIIIITHKLNPAFCNVSTYVMGAYAGIYTLYFAWASMVFHRQKNVWGFVKGVLVNVLYSFIVGTIIGIYTYSHNN